MEVAGERVETLERLSRGELRVLVTTARALLEKTRMPGALRDLRVELGRGTATGCRELADHLESIGFERVPMVEDVAQFAIRGGIFDVYSFGMAEPVRAEFWGDEIVDLRHFDLASQRSSRVVDRALVLPVDGQVRDEAVDGRARRDHVAPAARHASAHPARRAPRARAASERGTTRSTTSTSRVAAARTSATAPSCSSRPTSRPPRSVVSERSPSSEADEERRRRASAAAAGADRPRHQAAQASRARRDADDHSLRQRGSGRASRRVAGRRRPTPLAGGARRSACSTAGSSIPHTLRLLTDHEIFRRERRIRRARRYATATTIDTLSLKPGDFVVHFEHGVGIYRGIETIFVGQSTIEVAVVEYEGGDRLNVPLYRIDQLERYRSADDVSEDAPPPRLHHLGGRRWAQQREKARAAIQEMTVELLDLYARRKIATRPAHVPDTPWQRQLESAFLFEDTPDQRTATVQVKADMESTRPMDRLLVGDVGYGKTEIAVRAAFKAVQSGRQVAVLVPTTILADQHLRTFSERLADFPLRVAALSRFQNAKEQAATLVELKEKKIDVVIGTHRLLSEDVQFAELGLIVVDEEHRFGVKHKERLKQLKLQTDVLTLTATPIPRTLHLSLAGLRDMTLMQTPPRDRSPVLTYVEPNDDGLIEEGIARELDRGGQVFFVHNRIETIQANADHVKRIAPRARVGVAHGQMRERELEEVMHAFVNGSIDVLVSTMIVESGLDVPNANTMFVNRADHFGLAQLYQLRGRVGRSHRRAYCYLMVPDSIDPNAERRLQVLEHHTELGAGYRIALKDLEMRGAGNLLGAEQSGFVHAVGFDMYLRMLEDTVRRLMSGDSSPKFVPSEVTIDVPNYLPDDYVVSQDAKIDVYRRLARFEEPTEIEQLRGELRDRFGPLPAQAEAMLALAQLRIIGGALGIEGILVRGDEARITFRGSAVPRVKGLSAAFHDVQFQADVRRAVPLSLKLTRLGGAPMLDGLVRALRGLVQPAAR